MAFLDELSNKFAEMVKRVGEKSDELIGLGKLNYEIYREEDAVKKLYGQIGEVVYRAYSQENSSINAIFNICKEIDNRKAKIVYLKRQVEDFMEKKMAGETVNEASTDDSEGAGRPREEMAHNQREARDQPVRPEKQSQNYREEGQSQ